jgi:lysophospholipase L1-like esterase
MPTETAPNSEPKTTASHRKAILFRLAAIGLGLLPFLAFELILILFGWSPPGSVVDPYVGFSEIRPLFEKGDDGIRYSIAENRKPLFQPDSFLANKPDDEFRIFCVGGSTVQGRPFSIETAFSKWLELSLQATDNSRTWNAVNCGGVSYASYRLLPIVDEILDHEPDLIILYTGHNEFLEDRTYASVKDTSPWVQGAHDRLSAFRTYSFIRSQFVSAAETKPTEVLPAEVEAVLDFQGGLAQYRQDDQWKKNVVVHFEQNLRQMAAAITNARVPLILVNPVSNLRDVAPFKSVALAANSQTSELEVDQVLGGPLATQDPPKLDSQIQTLVSLLAANPRHAGVHFQLGQAYLIAGDVDRAKVHLMAAKEEDVCPLRAIEPIHDAIDRVRDKFSIPTVNVREHFVAKADDGIPGKESLVDHVHPSIASHQEIAELLLAQMMQLGMAKGAVDEGKITSRFTAHLESLDSFYFFRAKDRLKGLQKWTQGRVALQNNSDDGATNE